MSGGNVGGFGGCNRFTGTVAESGPGKLTFGKLASTKMACPDARMLREDGFLNNLRRVTACAFHDGRLALSWQDGSRKGSLLFGR